jgi:ABC-type bacteriocin/lantibiotic exporter with double-glycine peptidase domain
MFFNKLMKLPLRFFDNKNVGDIMQRIGDNSASKVFSQAVRFPRFFRSLIPNPKLF